MPHSVAAPSVVPKPPVEERDAATIRFAGDAGDGMQLVGTQFTMASALHGNAVCTMPDHPAEIRAPVGTLAGVWFRSMKVIKVHVADLSRRVVKGHLTLFFAEVW